MKKIFFISLFLIFIFIKASVNVSADRIEELQKQIDLLKSQKITKTADREKALRQLNEINAGIKKTQEEIKQKEEEIKKGEAALIYQKNLLNERAKSYYKNTSKNSMSLITVLTSQNLPQSLRVFFYQQFLVEQDKNTIIKIVLYIKKLEEAKIQLAQEKNRLISLKNQVAQLEKQLAKEIINIESQIAQLSALQQQLIAEKLASLKISRSAASLGRCDSDLTNGRDPGFSPKIAFFTYGVPNRVGMNQWGAYGRARAGQNEEEILRAYYDNFELKKDYDKGINITVDGYGVYNIEDYVKRIYEMPESWGNDGFAALKAQAIAARSYALAYTNNGQRSICATENCQVFKPDPKGGLWEEAVNQTAGWVMVQGTSPIKAWYSSTHGGYVFSSGEIGWSSTSWTKHNVDSSSSISSFSDLQNNAYDKDSPWFYCDWGSRDNYNKTAWLKPEEVADIVNVLILVKIDSSVGEHLYQLDRQNPAGVDTWSQEKVKEELRSRGKNPFNNITDISVAADFNAGRTTSITFSGDGGVVTFDAKEFKDWFNLRAPANIQIVGPLYNVEKR